MRKITVLAANNDPTVQMGHELTKALHARLDDSVFQVVFYEGVVPGLPYQQQLDSLFRESDLVLVIGSDQLFDHSQTGWYVEFLLEILLKTREIILITYPGYTYPEGVQKKASSDRVFTMDQVYSYMAQLGNPQLPG